MITRVLVGTLSFAALSVAASAADLPARSAPPVFVPPPAPVFSWTGFYLGANAGYAFDANRSHSLTANDATTIAATQSGAAATSIRNRAEGFTGGGQVGYNYQFGTGLGGAAPVLGVEADAAYTDLGRGAQALGATGTTAIQARDRQDYLGTVRGRAGVAVGSFLIYGTGGFAYGGVNDSTRYVSTGTGNAAAGTVGYAGSARSTRTGYAFGGGVEYAIPTSSVLNVLNAGAITLKLEYLHYDLGTASYRVSGTGVFNTSGTSLTDRVRYDGDLVRAGLNYKFDIFGSAPVVARY